MEVYAGAMQSTSVDDVNKIAAFLANEQQKSLNSIAPTDCIVLCGSAILQCAESVFAALRSKPTLTKTLVICGGIGHSTQYLYDTVACNQRYKSIWPEVKGQPESRILYRIFAKFYDAATVEAAGCQVIIEDQSTNCGANAVEARRLLKRYSIQPKDIVIVQDPTMSVRTLASFEKAYEDDQETPRFCTIPSFVPRVVWNQDHLSFEIPEVDNSGLWKMNRFLDLVLGEIPRLRDDERGYGPKGKGFIAHVEVPPSVINAWTCLSKVVSAARSREI